jgi:hypothetical protein
MRRRNKRRSRPGGFGLAKQLAPASFSFVPSRLGAELPQPGYQTPRPFSKRPPVKRTKGEERFHFRDGTRRPIPPSANSVRKSTKFTFCSRNSTPSAISIGGRRGGWRSGNTLDVHAFLAFRQFTNLAERDGQACPTRELRCKANPLLIFFLLSLSLDALSI